MMNECSLLIEMATSLKELIRLQLEVRKNAFYAKFTIEVRINKVEIPKHYDAISVAQALNKDFAKETKELFDAEVVAVKEAISTGIYVAYRPTGTKFNQQDCLRVSSTGRCFCSHLLKEHNKFSATSRNTACTQSGCSCKRFLFAPGRPEDFGEFWLPKRRDFNREAYRMKCKCKHTHEEHVCHPSPFRCNAKRCNCLAFSSASICAACDQRWEQHDTVFETEEERKNAGRQTGEDWYPFSELPAMRDIALTGEDNPKVEKLTDALPSQSQSQLPSSSNRPTDKNNSTPFRPSGQ
ncbi:unnamed protein product [Taenia asiatica]|uniref:Protein FAM221B n=1 Tax=Taenia asiatica TaxID=60517 RepID=A0A0R3W9Y9_TAEAS|nr:unnamed protein product [Taenia asiatica]